MLWVVLIALATFVVGSIGGWVLARRRARLAATATTSRVAPLRSAVTNGATDDTGGAGSDGDAPRSSSGSNADTDDLAEVSGHRLDPAASTSGGEGAIGLATPAGASRIDAKRDERRRYADIIGIETENASLRAIAARVPALERRIRELEALAEPPVESGIDPVIDLTGPTPVVHDGDADVAAR